eukprot:TRINITY_DN30863_c0_g1_i2.p1 TRINITY_DN30863_c0_g1~~TRINITY_DN30863_c0_g1_i2.p1  ORF type:complete len:321 (+),score=94.75 TRINITY_DN30863_c0_g1_i2:82-1044(+)
MGDASQAESSLAASEGVQQDERKDKSWLWRQLTEKESECSKLERALSSAQAEWNAERSRLRRELAALGAQLQAQAAQLQQAEGESTKLRKELAGALGLSDEEPEPPRCRVRQSDSPATAVSGACGSDTAEVEAAAVCSDREALAEETSKAAVVAEPPEAQDDRQLLQDDVKQVPAVPAVWLRRLRRRAGFERKRAKFALFRLRAVRRRSHARARRLQTQREELFSWRDALEEWSHSMAAAVEAEFDALDSAERAEASQQSLPEKDPAIDELPPRLVNCSKESRQKARGDARKSRWPKLSLPLRGRSSKGESSEGGKTPDK